jgi:CheY-like chemotaxis protein
MYLSNVHFLVVEDNQFDRQLMRDLLSALGSRHVTTAKDANEAYKLVKDINPDVAIVDWEMRPVSGIEFARRVRTGKDSPNQFLPIIMVSGHATRGRIFAARDSGVNEYVVKPLSVRALFNRIQQVIERPRRFVRIGRYFGPDRRRQAKQFGGDEKRGVAAPKVKKVAVADQAMGQEEINALFNPDEANGGAGGKPGSGSAR